LSFCLSLPLINISTIFTFINNWPLKFPIVYFFLHFGFVEFLHSVNRSVLLYFNFVKNSELLIQDAYCSLFEFNTLLLIEN
jgi:hypothetical protein